MKGCSFKMNIYIQNHIIQETDAHMTRHIVYGEIALIVAVCINSFAVVLMLYSGAGISAISSVPYAFSEVLPKLSLGTWTYIFQGLLVLTLQRTAQPWTFDIFSAARTISCSSRIVISANTSASGIFGVMTSAIGSRHSFKAPIASSSISRCPLVDTITVSTTTCPA